MDSAYWSTRVFLFCFVLFQRERDHTVGSRKVELNLGGVGNEYDQITLYERLKYLVNYFLRKKYLKTS